MYLAFLNDIFVIVQNKNTEAHRSHRGKGSANDRYEQMLTPILDVSPTKERRIEQRQIRKAKSQVSNT